jgi:undecaprenyl diphosphate synthase
MTVSAQPSLALEPAAAGPRHVAIIMDGNGRWASARGLPRVMGHRAGVQAVRNIVRAIGDFRIPCATLYSFSSENWKRPASEISDLMGLLKAYINEDLEELHSNGVEIRIIGSRKGLSPDIVALVQRAEDRTRGNPNLKLTIAFNYGGQNEIVEAARRVAMDAAAGRLDPRELTPQIFARYLETDGIPDPDLVIRTSGEKRLSNFLLWQTAYSELVFVDKLWPDFTKADLAAAMAEFGRRTRKFGAVTGEGA